MAITFAHDAAGGFTVGDAETGRTAYAYPTSYNANWAKRVPVEVAAHMIDGQMSPYAGDPGRVEYDARNWQTLKGLGAI